MYQLQYADKRMTSNAAVTTMIRSQERHTTEEKKTPRYDHSTTYTRIINS